MCLVALSQECSRSSVCFKYLHIRYVKELCVRDRRNGLVERFRGTAEILPKGRGMVVIWSRGKKPWKLRFKRVRV